MYICMYKEVFQRQILNDSSIRNVMPFLSEFWVIYPIISYLLFELHKTRQKKI